MHTNPFRFPPGPMYVLNIRLNSIGSVRLLPVSGDFMLYFCIVDDMSSLLKPSICCDRAQSLRLLYTATCDARHETMVRIVQCFITTITRQYVQHRLSKTPCQVQTYFMHHINVAWIVLQELTDALFTMLKVFLFQVSFKSGHISICYDQK